MLPCNMILSATWDSRNFFHAMAYVTSSVIVELYILFKSSVLNFLLTALEFYRSKKIELINANFTNVEVHGHFSMPLN